jgi:hypothetical protein
MVHVKEQGTSTKELSTSAPLSKHGSWTCVNEQGTSTKRCKGMELSTSAPLSKHGSWTWCE